MCNKRAGKNKGKATVLGKDKGKATLLAAIATFQMKSNRNGEMNFKFKRQFKHRWDVGIQGQGRSFLRLSF